MVNNDFGKFLEKARIAKGFKSQRRLADKIGVSSSTLSRIEKNIQTPLPDTLKILSEHLDLGYAELMEKASYFKGLSPEQKEYMKNFFVMHYEVDSLIELLLKSLSTDNEFYFQEDIETILSKFEESLGVKFDHSPYGVRKMLREEEPDLELKQKLASELKNLLSSVYDYISDKNAFDKVNEYTLPYNTVPYNPATMIKVPVLGSIAAGQPITRIEHIEGYEYVDPDLLRGKEAFALKVKGNSMSGDHIYDGDVVIAIVQPEVTSSDIAVVSVNGDEATLKRVKCKDDMCMLIPSNPQMEPSLVQAQNIEVLGKIVEVRKKFK